MRTLLLAYRGRFIEVCGLERIQPQQDPFILALNHSQRAEAILIPTLLGFQRQGRLIHFLADWNFLLIPGVGMIFRCGQVIPIARKPAKPKFLNVLKPLLTDPVPGFERARRKLEAGASIGLFPEGTTNPDPRRLLRGYSGAARLAIQTGKPVLPAGVRFPGHANSARIPGTAAMSINIGPPVFPPQQQPEPELSSVREFHADIMQRISELSGKQWEARSPRKRYVA